MLCGVGDARHLFMTIAIYFIQRKNASQKVHFTILDHKPVVMARVLIFLYLMLEAGDSNAGDYDANTALMSVCYLFCAQLMPQWAAEKVEFKLENEENPFKMIHIQTSQMKGLAAIIRRWRRDAKTMFPAAKIRRAINLDIARSSPSTLMIGEKRPFMRRCEADHSFFDEFSVVLPSAEFMVLVEPKLPELVALYRSKAALRFASRSTTILTRIGPLIPPLSTSIGEKTRRNRDLLIWGLTRSTSLKA